MKCYAGIVCSLLLLTLSACSMEEDKKHPESSPAVNENLILLAENKDSNVKLTGVEKKSLGLIRPIIVESAGKTKSFDWESVSNPSYYPELVVTDLDQDQRKEIVVFLTEGYGTGVRESKAHVLLEDLSEILFPDPKEDARKEISDSLTKQNGSRIYTLNVKGETSTFTFKEGEAGEWFDHAVIGNSVTYRMNAEQVVASVSVQVSPGMVIGALEITYRLSNQIFKQEAVHFSPYQ